MSIEGKVAEMIMGLIKLKSVELDDLFRFSEAIVQLVKLEVKKDGSLKVREKCKRCEGKGALFNDESYAERCMGFCDICHGTGYIEREPTSEELAELWETAKKECISCEGRQLKSGVIIFRKEKDVK